MTQPRTRATGAESTERVPGGHRDVLVDAADLSGLAMTAVDGQRDWPVAERASPCGTTRRARSAAEVSTASVTSAGVDGHLVRPSPPEDRVWLARPALAIALRIGVAVVPVALAVAVTLLLTRFVRRPAGGMWAQLAWFACLAGVSTMVLAIVGRLARRLLPVSTLLGLSLVFPDRAPRRFAVALRSGTTKTLEDRLSTNPRQADADAAREILSLVADLGRHDRLTRGHCERVRAFNDLLAEEIGVTGADRDRLRWAALLHDIGKLGVASRTLTKRGRLTPREWELLRTHPTRGAHLASGLDGWLGLWARAIPEHHERWDGGGYPSGLAGDEICLGGRIVAVADAFEVMTARRPYSRPISAQAARRELATCAGTQFDPAVVRAFLNISIGKLHRAIGPLAWLAELPLIGSAPPLSNVAAAAGRTAAGLGVGAALAAGAPAAHPKPPTTATTVTAPAADRPSAHPNAPTPSQPTRPSPASPHRPATTVIGVADVPATAAPPADSTTSTAPLVGDIAGSADHTLTSVLGASPSSPVLPGAVLGPAAGTIADVADTVTNLTGGTAQK